MNNIFEETKIGNITLRNKIIRSATHEGLADENGNPTEQLTKKYMTLAKGGVGAIITGYAGVQQNGKSFHHNMLMIDKDICIPFYKKMVDEVHKEGTPIILQVAHCGRQTRSKITGMPTVAPSAIRDKLLDETIPMELSENEIWDIIQSFAAAVERAKAAGFDGVQLHLAHGYLLSSFLSPHMNKRTDKWGGNTENRYRIVQEIITLCREKVGNYPILAKINAFEKSKDGIKIEEAVRIAKHLENSGFDAIGVSCGIAEEGFVTTRGAFPFEMTAKYNHKLQQIPKLLHPVVKPILTHTFKSPNPISLYNVKSAEIIKKHVTIPIIVVGGIKKLDDIKDIIENSKADFVSMSKPFIIEPDIVKKFKEQKQTVSKCIDCNYCLIGIEGAPLKCFYGRLPS